MKIKCVAWPSAAETDTFVDASRLVVPLPLLTDVTCDPVILEQFNIIVVFNSFILVICRNIVFSSVYTKTYCSHFLYP